MTNIKKHDSFKTYAIGKLTVHNVDIKGFRLLDKKAMGHRVVHI